jgi:hypothetical protein
MHLSSAISTLVPLALVLTVQTASASTLTVAVNGGGDCTSINACLARAGSGDTVIVRAGTYQDEFLSNTIPSGVTLRAEPARGAILRYSNSCSNVFPIEVNNQNVTIDGLVSDATGVSCGLTQHVRIGANARNITLQNGELTGGHNTQGASTSHGIVFTGNGVEHVDQGVVVRNMRIHDMGMDTSGDAGTQSYAFYAASSGILFEGNEVYAIGGFGVHMYCTEEGGCNNNVFRNNCFHDNRDGILFASGGADNRFESNVVVHAPSIPNHAAIQLGGYGGASSRRNHVVSNTFVSNRSVCIELRGSFDAEVRDNTCWHNDGDLVQVSNASLAISGPNRMGQDPGAAASTCQAMGTVPTLPRPTLPAPTHVRLLVR